MSHSNKSNIFDDEIDINNIKFKLDERYSQVGKKIFKLRKIEIEEKRN